MVRDRPWHLVRRPVPVDRDPSEPVEVAIGPRVDIGLGRRADRVVDEGPVEIDAILRDPVHVRGGQAGSAHKAQLSALVFSQDEQNVGVIGGRRVPDAKASRETTRQRKGNLRLLVSKISADPAPVPLRKGTPRIPG